MSYHLHLDCIGGIAGDMFLAALLDARPDALETVNAAIAAMHGPGGLSVVAKAHRDHVFAGTHVTVEHPHEHAHRTYRDLKALLAAADLSPAVRQRAEDMFRRLAECESAIHGIALDDVHLHEVAAWDSIADMVGAAALIEYLEITTCSVSALPPGAGRVHSAHGPLPVPAPATVMLLEGYRFEDDGVGGERVTPTGAVILRHLEARQEPFPGGHALRCQGFGFGTKKMDGISNVLRAVLLEPSAAAPVRDRIGVIAFEVDDQSSEDLSAGLDTLRALHGVLDVIQSPVFGKKGRMGASVQVLCRNDHLEAIAEACLVETATLGVRLSQVERMILPRQERTVTVHGATIRVKLAERPDGTRSAKAEADDIGAAAMTAAERQRLRRAAEEAALKEDDDA
jgi:pyridinium-3,5-bisthiocarboxylic acid mononucleotide nickel chelatase